MYTIRDQKRAITLGVAYIPEKKKIKYVKDNLLAPASIDVSESQLGPQSTIDSGSSDRGYLEYGPLPNPTTTPSTTPATTQSTTPATTSSTTPAATPAATPAVTPAATPALDIRAVEQAVENVLVRNGLVPPPPPPTGVVGTIQGAGAIGVNSAMGSSVLPSLYGAAQISAPYVKEALQKGFQTPWMYEPEEEDVGIKDIKNKVLASQRPPVEVSMVGEEKEEEGAGLGTPESSPLLPTPAFGPREGEEEITPLSLGEPDGPRSAGSGEPSLGRARPPRAKLSLGEPEEGVIEPLNQLITESEPPPSLITKSDEHEGTKISKAYHENQEIFEKSKWDKRISNFRKNTNTIITKEVRSRKDYDRLVSYRNAVGKGIEQNKWTNEELVDALKKFQAVLQKEVNEYAHSIGIKPNASKYSSLDD